MVSNEHRRQGVDAFDPAFVVAGTSDRFKQSTAARSTVTRLRPNG
jgi:hypothetical protein